MKLLNFLKFNKLNRLLIVFLVLSTIVSAQQDPQYTQYMYNTQVVNPAYAGSRGMLSFGLLGRSQWVGIDGAPKTLSFTTNSPIGTQKRMGIGLDLVLDEIGPVTESNINIDYSYTIYLSKINKLAFGIKAGIDLLNIDYNKLNIDDMSDARFQNNIENKLDPQIGCGIFFNNDVFYLGLSVPNFLTTRYYDENNLISGGSDVIASERQHFFLISGYVFSLNDNIKFKPATFIKAVSGSPLQWDISANFLFNDKFTTGVAYRWDAAVSALVGFNINENIMIGAAYDYQTTDIQDYSDGSYELILRFDIFNKEKKTISPRFF